MAGLSVSPPELLGDSHAIDAFDCGVLVLDDWLRRRARQNQASGASRTYVVAEANRVVGYFSLASGALATTDAPGRLRRNMPDPIPMVVPGRLAVDRGWQRQGLGVALLRDAVLRTAAAADILGIRGLIVHALSEPAKLFYERHGFTPSPLQPMTLVLSLKGFWSERPL